MDKNVVGKKNRAPPPGASTALSADADRPATMQAASVSANYCPEASSQRSAATLQVILVSTNDLAL